MRGFTNALKGIGGEFELSRVVGFISGVGYTVGALGFTAWNMSEGREFDVVAFCGAFAAGAAIITGGTAGAVAIKDRNVASAKVIEATGSKPATPPAPAPPPQPELAVEKPLELTPDMEATAEELPSYARPS